MGVSIVLALGGIGIAWYVFQRRREAADAVAARFAAVHRLLLGKYFVDELYTRSSCSRSRTSRPCSCGAGSTPASSTVP